MAALPPAVAMYTEADSDIDADAYNTSLLSVRGIVTTAQGQSLYNLTDLVLENCEMSLSPFQIYVLEDTPPPSPDLDADQTGATTAENDEDRRIKEKEREKYDRRLHKTYKVLGLSSHIPSIRFVSFYMFFYGSLQIESVLTRVCKITHGYQNGEGLAKCARLTGWRVKMYGNEPALVAAGDDDYVEGAIWRCTRLEDVQRIADYMTDAYDLTYINVRIYYEGRAVASMSNVRTFVPVLDPLALKDGEFDAEKFMNDSK
ncbi:hypothetical protein F4777DRAFT_598998 [Nemania sp. FL0916]|nr:hypothetical protein F4777DRAFT_598998 [Nemania sp. FL0916]